MKKRLLICLVLATFGLLAGCNNSPTGDTSGNKAGASDPGKSQNPMHDSSSAPK